jgi:predicted DCC family thiol-disulfide oxidoreductase YuxK
MKQQVLIVYDGACPFCTAYTLLVQLREQFQVELLSARSADPRVDEFLRRGYLLDEGMLLQIGHEIYVGAGAMHRLATLSNTHGILNQMQRAVFFWPWLARMLYPLLRWVRRLALLVRGVPLIQDARVKH